MFKKIDIKQFGVFNEFIWDRNIEGKFEKVNILYGRNYSGKTTISRIFRSLEEKTVHKDYNAAEFTLKCEDESIITEKDLPNQATKVRVYNKDYVRTNLSWLHDEGGNIQPFTILGAHNVELDKKIKEIEEKLGNEDEKKGLLYEYAVKKTLATEKKQTFTTKQSALQSKLKVKANDDIKVKNIFFVTTPQKKNYQITDIQEEIDQVQKEPNDYTLTEEKQSELKRVLLDSPKTDVPSISPFGFNFSAFIDRAKTLLEREIKVTGPIIELVENNLLEKWVLQGISLHREISNTCKFCGGDLPPDIWEKLDAHFSKETEDLKLNLETLKEELNNEKVLVSGLMSIPKESFYSSYQSQFLELEDELKSNIDLYISEINTLIQKIELRVDSISKKTELKEYIDYSAYLTILIERINNLIKENNKKTSSLAVDQGKARSSLRLNEVLHFIKDIEYSKEKLEIEEAERVATIAIQNANSISELIKTLEEDKRSLEAETNDESKGAEKVNKLLSKYFGHDELKLIAFGQTPNIKFKIVRENDEAKNLSEGECSLISFCYYIARVEDEINDENLVIYIDDPISSLDNNHIFFMFSLIENVIAANKKYEQLFISTHNLDFLKYLKRLTVPYKQVNYFLVERKSKQNQKKSVITLMPSHIRDYVTEFNYLFNEIYKIYKEVQGDRKIQIGATYNQFYNLPNNMRKFLECYLFYKYPNNDSPLDNLNKLFEGNVPPLINRIVNEFSHLTYLDRGWIPMDVGEAEQCAKIIIDKIKEKDQDQFEALVSSLN